jgi:hypothetical protein
MQIPPKTPSINEFMYLETLASPFFKLMSGKLAIDSE